MIKLEEFLPVNFSHHLLIEHSVNGSFRDESDIEISKFHSRISLDACIDFFKNIEGKAEDKIKFFENAKVELDKFCGKKD